MIRYLLIIILNVAVFVSAGTFKSAGSIYYKTFSPNSSLIISERYSDYSEKKYKSSHNISVVNLDEESSELLFSFPYGGGDFSASPNQRYFLVGDEREYNSNYGTFFLYDVTEREVLWRWDDRPLKVVWSPDSRYVTFNATNGGYGGKIIQVDLQERTKIEVDNLKDGYQQLTHQEWNVECECFIYAFLPGSARMDIKFDVEFFSQLDIFQIVDGQWTQVDKELSFRYSPDGKIRFDYYADYDTDGEIYAVGVPSGIRLLSIPYAGISSAIVWSENSRMARFVGYGLLDFEKFEVEIKDSDLDPVAYNEKYTLLYSGKKQSYQIVDTMTLKVLKEIKPFWREDL